MEKRIIANMKSLGIDMINQANSGHPGIVLGAAPIIYTVYANHLRFNVKDPLWINRDRFVLSAGHGSALLYSCLFLSGFNLTIDDLKKFRKITSKTPGHPEYLTTPGVDVSTGPLGQGLATSVGMAIAEKMLESKYVFPKEMHNEVDQYLINYRIYTLVGDGDLMEGISYEAASLAGTLNLDNLIVLYDSNNVSLDGDTSNTFVENVCDRFKSMGWFTQSVNSHDVSDINAAINLAKDSGMPSFIEIKTIIGEDSKLEGNHKVHGKPLTKEDITNIKLKLGISNEPFYVDVEAQNEFQNKINLRNNEIYNKWVGDYQQYVRNYLHSDDSSLKYLFSNGIKTSILSFPWEFDEKLSLREINNEILSEIALRLPSVVGGSADVASSTKAFIKGEKLFKEGYYYGRNIAFGVREGLMGAALNGIALSKLRPFGSSFLAFADYMKPAIRMSALMKLPVTYIFTHDTIKVGEDGPTHQPIEQLAMLRSIPNLNVYRPADCNELVGCWNEILNSNTNPSALVVSKDVLPKIPTTDKTKVKYGAYIVKKEASKPSGIIVSTGSELITSLKIAYQLKQEVNYDIRVVSMPSMELFLKQDQEYQNFILPKGIKTIILEASSSFGWHQFTHDNKYLLTIDHFGFSGSSLDVETRLNYNYDQLKQRVKDLLD